VLVKKRKMNVTFVLKFDALCCSDSEARWRQMLPAIEQLLRPASVQRACIVKLYHDKVGADQFYYSSLTARCTCQDQ